MASHTCILVGYGYWGKILEKYLKPAGFEIESVYTSASEEPFEDVLKRSRSEVVFICSPVSSHAGYVRAALEAGRHVFCEKMLCGDADLAEELLRIADEAGKVLFTDYIYLYSPSVNRIKEYAGEAGDIHTFTAEITQFGKFYKDADVIGNIGVHMISVAGYISDFALPQNIICRRNEPEASKEGQSPEDVRKSYELMDDQMLDATISYDAGDMHARIRASLISDTKARHIRVNGESGWLDFDMLRNPPLMTGVPGLDSSISYDEQNNLRHALDAFRTAIQDMTGSGYLINRRCSLYVEKVVEMISRQKKHI